MAGNSVIGALRVTLSADTAQFTTNLKQSQSRLAAFGKQVSTQVAGINKSLAGIGVSLVGGLGLEALTRTVRNVVADVARLADEAKRSGIDPETLQAIAFAGRQAGVETEKITDLMQKFNLEIGEAATKGGDLAKILAANGVEIRDSNGNLKDTESLFYRVVDLIKNAKSQQEAAVIAMAAFGKQAGDALPFLQQGAQAIQEGEGAARAAGAVISNELVAKADSFDDAWTAAWDAFSAKGKAAVIDVLSELTELFKPVDNLIARLGITSGNLRGGGLLPGLNENQISDLESLFPSLRENAEAVRVAQEALNVELAKQLELEKTIAQLKADGRPQIEIDEYIDRLDVVNARLAEARKQLNQFASALPSGYSNETIHAGPGATGGPGLPTVIPDLGGGGKPKKTTSTAPKNRSLDAFQREIAQVVEMTRAYELAAQSIGLTTAQVETLQTRFDLLNAAQKANVQITPEVAQLIEQLAQQAGDAAQKVEDLEKRQAQINEISGSLREGFKGFFTDLANGVKPIDALTAALQRLEQKLLDLALNSIFDSLFGSLFKAGAESFTSNFSLGYEPGLFEERAIGGPVMGGRPYIVGERGPEMFVPSRSGHIISNKDLQSGGGGGGDVFVTVHNAPSTPRVSQSTDGFGNRRVELMFDEMVAKSLYRGSGAKVLEQVWGNRRVPRRT